MDVTERAKKIKLLLLDVDGVMTDGRIVYGDYGDELKNFNVNDGMGILLIKRAGMKCVIITAKGSRIVKKRAKVLKIDKVYSDFHYKIKALEHICRKFNVREEEICFMGDDIIDIPILKRVGFAVAVPNAVDEVKKIVHYTTEKKGGKGAVREVCDMLLKAQGKWEEVTKAYFV